MSDKILSWNRMPITGFGTPGVDGPMTAGVGQGFSQKGNQPMSAINMSNLKQQPSPSKIAQGPTRVGRGEQTENVIKAVTGCAGTDGQRQLRSHTLLKLRETAKTACKPQVKLHQVKHILQSDSQLLQQEIGQKAKQRSSLRLKQQQDGKTSSNTSSLNRKLTSKISLSVNAVDRPASLSSVSPLNNHPMVIITAYGWRSLMIKKEPTD